MAKKRRFGKKLTMFREAVKKLDPLARTPHAVTVLGVAMGLTVEKIEEEIGLGVAMFGHFAANGAEWYPCASPDCHHGPAKHEHARTPNSFATRHKVGA